MCVCSHLLYKCDFFPILFFFFIHINIDILCVTRTHLTPTTFIVAVVFDVAAGRDWIVIGSVRGVCNDNKRAAECRSVTLHVCRHYYNEHLTDICTYNNTRRQWRRHRQRWRAYYGVLYVITLYILYYIIYYLIIFFRGPKKTPTTHTAQYPNVYWYVVARAKLRSPPRISLGQKI